VTRDTRIFMTGVITALVVDSLLDLWMPPWWLTLITLPVAIWVVVQVVQGWRRELRHDKQDKERWR